MGLFAATNRSCAIAAITLVCWLAAATPTRSQTDDSQLGRSTQPHRQETLRRPLALALGPPGTLLVANRNTGSISVISRSDRQVQQEWVVGERLSDLRRVSPQGEGEPATWLALDEARHELMVLRWNELSGLQVVQRVATPAYPVSLERLSDGRYGVASLWSRRWSILTWEDDGRASMGCVLDLPFAPRVQLALPDGRHVLVADAFGNRIATIAIGDADEATVDDAAGGDAKLQCIHTFPSHHIRGLKLSPDGQRVLVAHQMLNDLARTVRNDVHWGLLMSNDVRWLRVAALLDPEGDLYQGAHVSPLGEPGNGSGDPTDLELTEDGRMLVTLGGVNELGVGQSERFQIRRVLVGRNPVAVLASEDGQTAWVANMLDDSLSEVNLERMEVTATISLGPQRPLTLAERGESVFYSAILSHDGWMSCNSCHIDGHANGMLNDNFSDDSFGAPKRVLSLLGRANTAPFAWTGSSADLESQIRKSIQQTMQSDREPREDHVRQLAAFLRTLPPPPALDHARAVADQPAIERGQAIFETHQCARCHTPPSYTSPERYDVGLKDELNQTEFNPPPLVGVGQRGPYFHDGRTATLGDVFREFQHQLDDELTARNSTIYLPFFVACELDDAVGRHLPALRRGLANGPAILSGVRGQ